MMAEDVNSPAVEFNTTTDGLNDAPYTKNLLSHAHPEHLHQTTARLFIGPLPQDWGKTHKRNWYGTKKKYTNRAITFNAQPENLTRRRLSGLTDPGQHPPTRETISQSSEQVISSDPASTVSTSLQFTSDTGTSPSSEHPVEQRRESSLDNFIRTSPIVKSLSPGEQWKKEEELRRLEVERDERRQEREIEDLQPIPSKDDMVGITPEGSRNALAKTVSQEPLLRAGVDDDIAGESIRDSIDA